MGSQTKTQLSRGSLETSAADAWVLCMENSARLEQLLNVEQPWRQAALLHG